VDNEVADAAQDVVTRSNDLVGQAVDQALAIMDRDGVDALTMRTLGARLGVAPSTLYLHVSDKREIVQLIFERLLPLDNAPRPKDWHRSLAKLASDVTEAVRRHPGLPTLVEADATIFATHLRSCVEVALNTTALTGLDRTRAVGAFTAGITGAVIGSRSAEPDMVHDIVEMLTQGIEAHRARPHGGVGRQTPSTGKWVRVSDAPTRLR
jgi:AcrR family transcriptional regulator